MHGLNHYDYSARQYDPDRAKFTTVDPYAENYYSWSPYAYVANNPMRLIDKNGKDWTDILSGATDAINNNISIGVTDAVGINQQSQVISASDYNTGRIIGDVVSVVMGAAEIIVGGAAIGGGGAASSTGVGAVIGIPVAAEGAVLTTHGVGTIGKAIQGNGRISEMNSNNGKYNDVPNSKNTGEGRKFTPSHKKRLLDANRKANNGELKSDLSGKPLDSPIKSKKGVKANMNQAEVDHVKPKSKGGTNSSSNAQILSKEENLRKSNK